jgi:vancomycin resistance protein YoaR
MNSTRVIQRKPPDLLSIATLALQALFSAGIVFLVGVVVFLLGARVLFAGRALPGVHAAGVELGGMTVEQIESTLNQVLTYPESGLIVLRDGGEVRTAHPVDLGVLVDIPAMARQAISIGRQGNPLHSLRDQIDAWYQGRAIAPLILFDQWIGEHYLLGIAAQIDRPTFEATLTVSGTDVEHHAGQIGRQLNIPNTLEALADPIGRLHDADINLVIEETPPLVLDASETAATARQILSEPLTLTADDAGPWTFQPNELASMLRFNLIETEGESYYEVSLDAEELVAFLEPLAPELERKPQNARFIFNDDTLQLDLRESAIIGRELDIQATTAAIHSELNSGFHQIPLTFIIDEPAVGDQATAEELGISEAVSVVSTSFSGSSSGRKQNIETASGAFHGLLVAPGETLSMAEVLGDISLDNGYAEALIIYGNRTIKGVGGGVCQVSTTLFRAVFFGGFPIEERHPHAYRVGYYEQGRGSPGPGLDATVFVPIVDFKFTNDTPNWLLLETYIYGDRLEWKFYSTSDGRSVDWRSVTSGKVEAPKPLYKKNSKLKKGEIKKVDYEADGLDVVVYRTVTRDTQTLYDDVIKTHYLPWRAIYEYGPGTDLPDDVEIED